MKMIAATSIRGEKVPSAAIPFESRRSPLPTPRSTARAAWRNSFRAGAFSLTLALRSCRQRTRRLRPVPLADPWLGLLFEQSLLAPEVALHRFACLAQAVETDDE